MATSAWDELQRVASEHPGVRLLDQESAERVASRLCAAYVRDPSVTLWWTALRDDVSVETVTYGTDDPWERALPSLIPDRQKYVLLVTDERSEPEGAASGSLAALAALVRDLPFFEYAVTD